MRRTVGGWLALFALVLLGGSADATTVTPSATTSATPTCTPSSCALPTCGPGTRFVCPACGCGCSCEAVPTATATPACTVHVGTCRRDEVLVCNDTLGCPSCQCVPATRTAINTRRPTVRPHCSADCDGDGQVRIDDLLRGVGIALGIVEAGTCSHYHCPQSDCVVIQLLISAVEQALNGCPPDPPTPTPTASAAATPPPTTSAEPSPTLEPTPPESTATVATTAPTATPTPDPHPLLAALTRVMEAQCTWNSPGPFLRRVFVLRDDECDGAGACLGGYGIDCDGASGHASDATLRRYRSADDAIQAFDQASTGGEAEDFEGLPAVYWEQPFFLGGAHRYLLWRLDCWVVRAHSFDDTHFRIAAQPRPFSSAILAESAELLTAACEATP